jgi:hypothetical protein
VEIPVGDHEVLVRFGATLPRQIGWALTGLAAVACLFIFAKSLRGHSERISALPAVAANIQRRVSHIEEGARFFAGHSPRRTLSDTPAQNDFPHTRLLLAAAFAVVILYVGLTAWARLSRPADYTPATVSANFTDEIKLIGFHAPPDELCPGREGTVTLHWLALQPAATDYKVFVHLIDATGALWAQHDGEPGFFFSPTTRWQQGEIVDDVHVLEWQGEPPPGRYQLRAGLYDPASGERLPVLGPDGAVVDDQVLLAEFEIR